MAFATSKYESVKFSKIWKIFTLIFEVSRSMENTL